MEIEEDYKEDGKYVGYYSITGDAGFAGTEKTEYYRVRSDRRLDEKEVAVFLAEEELREISADTWQSWTDRELLFASKQVANFTYTYGPQLGSITPGDYKSQQEDWKYLLKFLFLQLKNFQ
jgi:hypothetical protein